ncbi:unnamed protein product [Leptidea sinapis]|uniref:Uncharacterized protein n=1 Tax=Leptidea sinapis TaxID=189913 RepID=A0A5E4Q1R0_9NEOP|nr:unnamed protein product [Leptidea sinapis]
MSISSLHQDRGHCGSHHLTNSTPSVAEDCTHLLLTTVLEYHNGQRVESGGTGGVSRDVGDAGLRAVPQLRRGPKVSRGQLLQADRKRTGGAIRARTEIRRSSPSSR